VFSFDLLGGVVTIEVTFIRIKCVFNTGDSMRIVKIENIKIRKVRRSKKSKYFLYRINLPASYFRHGLLKPGECTLIIIQRDKEDEELPEIKIDGVTESSVIYVGRPELLKREGEKE